MANSDYVIKGGGGFTPYATLAAAIDQVGETITFADLVEPVPNSLKVGMTLMIEKELLLLYELGTGTMKCRRGCADTIPWVHGKDVAIWFIESTIGGLRTEYAGGDTLSVKILPYIPGGQRLKVPDAVPTPITMNWRFFRPYPPAQMRVNGARWFTTGVLSSATGSLALTWVHRNRVVQADILVGHDEANVPPEVGQTYTLRVYDQFNTLVRTEVGITGQSYGYLWAQALNDFGLASDPVGQNYNGRFEFESERDTFASWQFYNSNFVLNNKNAFMVVAQAGTQAAQPTTEDAVRTGALVGQSTAQIAQNTVEGMTHALMTGQLSEAAGQATSFTTALARKLFEAPYTHLLRKGVDPNTNRVMTAAARPSDRLTDTHLIYARTDYSHPFALHDQPVFTPWLIIDEAMEPLQNVVSYHRTSHTDGVPLTSVQPGQIAMLAGELVRVEAINSTHVTLARGCVDTVPTHQMKDTWLWFIGAGSGLSGVFNNGAVVDNRVVPGVYGPALDPTVAPSDSTTIANRHFRPFPPGKLQINGQPWYVGGAATLGADLVFTWTQRNRFTQGDTVLDHTAASVPAEAGTQYRFKIEIRVTSGDTTNLIKIREVFLTGESFVYTYDMAVTDGLRIGRLLDVCGWVYVPLYVDARRDDHDNWQGYAIPLRLPAAACPINKPPGGGQGPVTPPTGGTGDGGNPGTNPPPDPKPPVLPPTWPPVPPDPIKPTDPGEPDPDTTPDPDDDGLHWDFIWDIHWDAYRRYGDDDIGEGG